MEVVARPEERKPGPVLWRTLLVLPNGSRVESRLRPGPGEYRLARPPAEPIAFSSLAEVTAYLVRERVVATDASGRGADQPNEGGSGARPFLGSSHG